MKRPYGAPESSLAHYRCRRASRPFGIDGRLDKEPWLHAEWSPRFVDLVSGAPALLGTRMAALWDEENLYVAFRVEEPDVRAEMTERDSPVYLENDVEVFIGGEDCYYEFQVNARGTIYEVFYIWQRAFERGGRFDTPEFDLLKGRVDVLGGFQDASRHNRHPRGKRWAFLDWDLPGLRAAVQVDGTLNDPSDTDGGWTAEIAFPWRGMASLFLSQPLPPRPGDTLRLDFSRFEKLESGGRPVQPSPGWALNAHGVYDSHIPECFSFVHLVK